MEELENIKKIVALIGKMQNLCEGFDDTNKTAVLTTKIRILLELSQEKQMSPSILKTRVGLAKSNLALLCNTLKNQGIIEKKKDEFDSRSIFYLITEKGEGILNRVLKQMKKNFEGEVAYKNNMKQINTSVEQLAELIK